MHSEIEYPSKKGRLSVTKDVPFICTTPSVERRCESMSKKAKALLIISSIALTLILSGSITWLIYGRNTVESASQPDNAVLNNKTTESISEDPNICLQTEVETIASTIAENIITTEAIEAIPVQSAEAAASDHDPGVVIAENKPKPVTAKAPEKPTTVDAPPSTNPVPKKLADQPTEKTDDDASKKTEAAPSANKPSYIEKVQDSTNSDVTKTDTSPTKKNIEPVEEPTTAKTTEASTESQVTDPPTVKTSEKTTEKTTEAPKCNHNWVWSTHTETKTISAITHDVPVYDDGWDEGVTVQKVYCSECEKTYDTSEDYYAYDRCHGSSGLITVIDHYIHHEPELLFYDTIVDVPAHEETITVKDYQYCSICGERK